MPIYEYECPQCGVFEFTQRITEDPLEACPDCRSGIRKLISSTSFQLKGTGWYITDYGRSKGANGDKPEANGSKESSGADKSTDAGKSTESGSSGKSSSGDSAASTA